MMTNFYIAQQRLHSQQIAQHTFEKPEDIVSWPGAVQAQDYAAVASYFNSNRTNLLLA